MPLTTNEATLESAKGVLTGLKGAFGTPPGFRSAHSKGILLTGTFIPSAAAASLSTSPHFHAASTPVLARFSNGTGIPINPDNDSNSKPNGLSIRFQLPNDPTTGRRRHTDIIGHSTPHFPVQTGEEFAVLLQALGGGPETTGKYISEHPIAARFVAAPKPFAKSYTTQEYFGLHAYGFEAKDGKTTWLKYTMSPAGGIETISDEEAAKNGPNYLHDEIIARVQAGEPNIKLNIIGTLAKEGDSLNDITDEWEGEHETVDLGTVTLTSLVEGDAETQKKTIFDPVARVEGIKDPVGDKILDYRAALYLLSGRERRAA